MAADRQLDEYRRKRDFDRTSEPRPRAAKQTGRRRFVVQQHDATRLHYDFRLQVGDVLKSWAVPKGPSTDPRQRRLAMPTEDHPLDYLRFEGLIPEGEYGAGPVIVWDTGRYRNLAGDDGAGNGEAEVSMEEAIDRGHVRVWLDGEKLVGGYALTRTGGGDRWLLVKLRDEAADARRNPTSSQPESVHSGRTIEEVRDDG